MLPSKSYTTGDVISVMWFPHEEDKSMGEPRWLICLEDFGDKFMAVPLKSTIRHILDQPKSFIIEKESEEGKRMKLLNDSLVAPGRAMIMNKVVALKHGTCSDELLDKLQDLTK